MTREDTIAAIATAPGEGGVGIVRISGPRAIEIAQHLAQATPSLLSAPSHTVHHSWLRGPDGSTLDEALINIFRGPRSYTGDDVVEIGVHGGSVISRRVLRAVLSSGARLADRGEFTRRAFVNGRIDLSQAEAVIDLVRARTERGADAALRALAGRLAQRTLEVEDRLFALLSRLEVNLDFVEDVAPAGRAAIAAELAQCRGMLEQLARHAVWSRRLRDGATVVLLGRPNVGKSSVFNALVQDDRALVSETPGTTRDYIEAWMDVDGIPVRLIDTAGIRQASDALEKEGVRRSLRLEETASLRIVVLEAPSGMTLEDESLLQEMNGRPVLIAWNKSDLAKHHGMSGDKTNGAHASALQISARTGDGIEQLRAALGRALAEGSEDDGSEEILCSERHEDAVRTALQQVRNAEKAWAEGGTEELASTDVREAARALGDLTGKSVGDEVLTRIFSQFCIGK
ncbi:MAG TPA: tRNA uridine-5-carboxymethylaminomethyl(34) synthesis GTPase MnmE [bacterium]|nr:tRNA uridine-5-carboxymethylaminomethyl(34) synthesis GTPase MnmE [bacterium]